MGPAELVTESDRAIRSKAFKDLKGTVRSAPACDCPNLSLKTDSVVLCSPTRRSAVRSRSTPCPSATTASPSAFLFRVDFGFLRLMILTPSAAT